MNLTADQQQQQMQVLAATMAAAANAAALAGSVGNQGVAATPPLPGANLAMPGLDANAAVATSAQAPNLPLSEVQAAVQLLMQQQQQAYGSVMGMGVPAMPCGADPTFGMGSPFGAMGMYPPPAVPAMPGMPTVPLVSPIVVSVEGMQIDYELTQDDLHMVFSRYGSVQQINVDEHKKSAQITFNDMTTAQTCMKDLNGKVLNGLDGKIKLEWANTVAIPTPGAMPAALQVPTMTPQCPTDWAMSPLAWQATNPLADVSGMFAMGAQAGSTPGVVLPSPDATLHSGAGGLLDTSIASGGGGDIDKGSNAPPHVKGQRKHTCRFLIGIENEPEHVTDGFQVVRRIIGAKGTNMKRIVKQTEAKLRLRGVGSGYKEGAAGRESSEPLQLCVSCTSHEGYKTAVKLVEELLENIYTEYRVFCRENDKQELDLHASPQLVSNGGRGGERGGGGEKVVDIDDDDADGDSDADGGIEISGSPSGGRREGRRRGRRSRGKKLDSSKKGEEGRGDPPPKAPPVDEIERYIDQRNEARRQCNFTEADRIRQTLHEKGVALMDEPGARGKGAEVTTWRYWRE